MERVAVKRLAFIRYAFSQAVDQSHQSEPMSVLSILGFHDCVELFLGLAADTLNVGKPKMDFMELLGTVSAKLSPDQLEQRGTMKGLNDARVSLKHHGNLLSKSQTDDYRAFTTSFFAENTPKIFGVKFENITMIDLVQHEEVRESLAIAQKALDQGDTETSVINSARAFHQLLTFHNDGYQALFYQSPFYFGDDFRFDRSQNRRRGARPFTEQDRFEDKLVEAIEPMQSAIHIVSLGLDYRHYAKFQLLTPVVRRAGSRLVTQVVPRLTRAGLWPPSVETARFCINFVIDGAIRVQSAEVSSVMQMKSDSIENE